MPRIVKQICAVILIVGCLFSLGGCFDRRELDTLGIVMGVALDKGESEGDTVLTVQMANPSGGGESKSSKGKSSGESGGSSKPYINVSNSGKNMNYVVREMQHKMSRRVYVAHSQVIVLGEELAKTGVRDCLDFFARAAEARMTVYVFVAKGKASEVLDVSPEFEKMPSVELAKILRDQKITSHSPIVTEFELVNTFISKTTAGVAPIVSIIEDGEKQRLDVSGCAVFKGSKMVGTLDMNESRGLLFVKNKVKTGAMQVSIDDSSATVEIRRSKSTVSPVLYSDGTSRFNVEVETVVGLGDQSGTFNLADSENMNALLGAAGAVIKDEITSAVTKSKELGADILGFGEYLNRKYPDQWKQMSKNWDELYKNINVDVTVKAMGNGSGRIDQPLSPMKD